MARRIVSTEVKVEFEGIRFTDADLANPDDYEPPGKYPHHQSNVPWAILNEFGLVTIAFATNEQDALDEACDADRMNSFAVSEKDLAEMTDEERDELSPLGNASEMHDLTYCQVKQLPNPPFSFAAAFLARPDPRVHVTNKRKWDEPTQ